MYVSSAQLVRDAYAGRLWPDEQARIFARTEALFPTREVSRGGAVRPLADAEQTLDGLCFRSGGAEYDMFDYFSRNRIAGLLVLHGRRVLMERYQLGACENTRWMSMSMAKSVSSTLVGVAIQDGLIGSLDDRLVDYLPVLHGGAYEDVTVRQLLRMTSGARWNEDHTDPDSERRAMLELQIAQRPGTILDFMSRLPKVAPAGRRWNYSTGETHLVGALVHAATGQCLADYLSRKIWSRLGMEHDAAWWLESRDGLEVAGSGLCVTLRDFARFGAFIRDGGVIDSEPVLPPGWVDEAGAGHQIDGSYVPYGYMWWPLGNGERGFSARGIFGQRIYVDRARDLVVVILSARSKPMHAEGIDDDDFCRAVAASLEGAP